MSETLKRCIEIWKWRHLCATVTLNYNGSPSVGLAVYTFCIRTLTSKTSFRSPGSFKHDAVLMWALWGSWLPTSLQLSSLEVRSRTFEAHSRMHWSHGQNKQEWRQQSLEFRVVAYRLAYFIWWTDIYFEHRPQSNSNLFYLFKHVGQCNDASPGPKIRSPNRGKNW